MPTNERGPGMRLSSGPEHSLLTNRPVIVTQSDPPSSSPLPLQQRGSPYSHVVRRAAWFLREGTALTARPHQQKVRWRLTLGWPSSNQDRREQPDLEQYFPKES